MALAGRESEPVRLAQGQSAQAHPLRHYLRELVTIMLKARNGPG